MELSKLDPLREMVSLRDEIDRPFDSFFGRTPRLRRTEEGEWSPMMDVEETGGEFIVVAEIPGMRKEEINISLSPDQLCISGNKRRKDLKGITYHRLERSFGKFKKVVPLPSRVKTDKVKASYRDGLLTVILPKVQKARPKEISIEVK